MVSYSDGVTSATLLDRDPTLSSPEPPLVWRCGTNQPEANEWTFIVNYLRTTEQ